MIYAILNCPKKNTNCLMQKESPRKTLFGNIHKYCTWGLSYNKRNMS